MHLYQTAGEREMGKDPVKLGQRLSGGKNVALAVRHMLGLVLRQTAKQSDIIACPNQTPQKDDNS